MKGPIRWRLVLALVVIGVAAFWARRLVPGPEFVFTFPFLTIRQLLWVIGFFCISIAVIVSAMWLWLVYADEDYGKVSDTALWITGVQRMNESPRWQAANRWMNRIFWGFIGLVALVGLMLTLSGR